MASNTMCEEKLTMGNGKPLPPPLPDPEAYTVEFDKATDPTYPYNWKLSTKYAGVEPPPHPSLIPHARVGLYMVLTSYTPKPGF